jgi:hypothetical protein
MVSCNCVIYPHRPSDTSPKSNSKSLNNHSIFSCWIWGRQEGVEQRAIVGRLEEIYRQKIESLEELKRSVLQKAFTGEL